MSAHNLCFGAKISMKSLLLLPQFYYMYIRVGCKGVFVTRTCFLDVHFNFLLLFIHMKTSNVCMI